MIQLGCIEGGASISYLGRISKTSKHNEILRPVYEALLPSGLLYTGILFAK
jgi:hypothetical protein